MYKNNIGKPSSFLLLVIFFIVYTMQTSCAQENHHNKLDHYKQFKRSISQDAWETSSYELNDLVGYNRIGYKKTPKGEYHSWGIRVNKYKSDSSLSRHPAFILNRLYNARTAADSRGKFYSADQIGKIYRQNGIFYGNPGNSAEESMSIRKKYGLRPMEHVPGTVTNLNFTGFNKEDYTKYRDTLKTIMKGAKKKIVKKEQRYDCSIINNPHTLWVLTGSHIIHFFLNNLKKNYDDINKTFKQEEGFNIPLTIKPSTPKEKAHRSIFIQWMRSKMHGLMALQMKMFRRYINPEGIVISNIHGEDVIDFETHGAIVDHPGPSGRAQFSNHELVLRYWDGYIFRLWRDLTDKTLFASARINNGVVRARSIPTYNTVKYWHSQAVQNGTVGFYQWLRDYGPRDKQGNKINRSHSFSGPLYANPDSSTLPKQRWNAILDISRKLSHTKIFDPPTSKTGILLSFDSVNIKGWKRVFSAYVELRKAGVWNSFISDREILNGSENLNQWDVIYIPAMTYSHPKAIKALQEFVKNGGTLVSVDPRVFSFDMNGNDISYYRKELFGIKSRIKSFQTESVQLDSLSYSPQRIYSQERSYHFTPVNNTKTIGVYSDGKPAVVSHSLGKGKSIYWGMPLATIYLTNPDENINLDGRGRFFKKVEQNNNIKDYSWIWNISVDNLQKVTGAGKPNLPPIRSNVYFK